MSRRIVAALVACGALAVVPQALPASAAPAADDGGADVAAPSGPPVGKAWLEGVVTDQAGHTLQDVNVEAWPDDPDATEPVASDRTYENTVDDQQGYFRLEVPIHASYLIVISAEDDDFRTFQYHDGEPIKVGLRKERDLGTSEIARVAVQPSTTTAKIEPGAVKVGKQARITIAVACKNVDPVLGKVTASVGGKKVTGLLKQRNHGQTVLTLPKLKKPGKYTVEAWYLGDSYVKRSTTKKPLKLVVKK